MAPPPLPNLRPYELTLPLEAEGYRRKPSIREAREEKRRADLMKVARGLEAAGRALKDPEKMARKMRRKANQGPRPLKPNPEYPWSYLTHPDAYPEYWSTRKELEKRALSNVPEKQRTLVLRPYNVLFPWSGLPVEEQNRPIVIPEDEQLDPMQIDEVDATQIDEVDAMQIDEDVTMQPQSTATSQAQIPEIIVIDVDEGTTSQPQLAYPDTTGPQTRSRTRNKGKGRATSTPARSRPSASTHPEIILSPAQQSLRLARLMVEHKYEMEGGRRYLESQVNPWDGRTWAEALGAYLELHKHMPEEHWHILDYVPPPEPVPQPPRPPPAWLSKDPPPQKRHETLEEILADCLRELNWQYDPKYKYDPELHLEGTDFDEMIDNLLSDDSPPQPLGNDGGNEGASSSGYPADENGYTVDNEDDSDYDSDSSFDSERAQTPPGQEPPPVYPEPTALRSQPPAAPQPATKLTAKEAFQAQGTSEASGSADAGPSQKKTAWKQLVFKPEPGTKQINVNLRVPTSRELTLAEDGFSAVAVIARLEWVQVTPELSHPVVHAHLADCCLANNRLGGTRLVPHTESTALRWLQSNYVDLTKLPETPPGECNLYPAKFPITKDDGGGPRLAPGHTLIFRAPTGTSDFVNADHVGKTLRRIYTNVTKLRPEDMTREKVLEMPMFNGCWKYSDCDITEMPALFDVRVFQLLGMFDQMRGLI